MNFTNTITLTPQTTPTPKTVQETAIEVVVLPERFDAFASVELPPGAVPEGTSIVVDGRAVRFADLHALQSLVDARLDVLDAGGELHIGAPSLELLATLELTGFNALLSILSGETR